MGDDHERERYRCPVCRAYYERGYGTTTRCLVMHPPGSCCHHGETAIPDTYDDIPADIRGAADALIAEGESVRVRVRDVLADVATMRDNAERLWDAGNWARMYYDINDYRIEAVAHVAALAVDNPFVMCVYGCDAACMACDATSGTAHDDDCAWVAARRYLNKPTEQS